MKTSLLASLIPCAVLVACGRAEAPSTADPPLAQPPGATTPTAEVSPTTAMITLEGKSGRAVTGELQLDATDSGVTLTGTISGLAPGTDHGLHFHEKGDCSSNDAESAGAHFNPAEARHGAPASAEKHLGDLPNIRADADGRATVTVAVTGATLRQDGARDLMGKALVLHAQRDDYTTQPSGNSGARIACGVVR